MSGQTKLSPMGGIGYWLHTVVSYTFVGVMFWRDGAAATTAVGFVLAFASVMTRHASLPSLERLGKGADVILKKLKPETPELPETEREV